MTNNKQNTCSPSLYSTYYYLFHILLLLWSRIFQNWYVSITTLPEYRMKRVICLVNYRMCYVWPDMGGNSIPELELMVNSTIGIDGQFHNRN